MWSVGGEEGRCGLSGWVEIDRAFSKLAHPKPSTAAEV